MAYPQNIVLIDDDHDDYEIFLMALAAIDKSMQCTYYDDARQALNEMVPNTANKPDYIFLDLNMPALNGKECLKVIKQTAHLANIPSILYSTSIMPSDETAIMALGAHSFFTKPHSHDGLVNALRKIFEQMTIRE